MEYILFIFVVTAEPAPHHEHRFPPDVGGDVPELIPRRPSLFTNDVYHYSVFTKQLTRGRSAATDSVNFSRSLLDQRKLFVCTTTAEIGFWNKVCAK